MTNIRLTYAEGSGDFPVDNDFRRIGILKDPFTGEPQLSQPLILYRVSRQSRSLVHLLITFVDEAISQTVSGGTAYGTVVSWTLDSGSTTAGVLKYIQTNDAHTDQGVVRAFESNGANAISGVQSAASGNVDTGYSNTLLGSTFTKVLLLLRLRTTQVTLSTLRTVV